MWVLYQCSWGLSGDVKENQLQYRIPVVFFFLFTILLKYKREVNMPRPSCAKDASVGDIPKCILVSFSEAAREMAFKGKWKQWDSVLFKEDRIYYITLGLAIILTLSSLVKPTSSKK